MSVNWTVEPARGDSRLQGQEIIITVIVIIFVCVCTSCDCHIEVKLFRSAQNHLTTTI